jgi:parallel beta-helix repeat protein
MAKTIIVSNSAQLVSAMQNAHGGENIVLQGGNYGSLSLWQNHTINAKYSTPITISSANHSDPAVFTGLKLNGLSNIKFSDVKFDYVSSKGEPTTTSKFTLLGCNNVSIVNSVFDGDTAKGLGTFEDGFGSGRGLTVRDCSNITVSGNEIFNFNRGIVTTASNNVKVTNNNLYKMSSDGLDFAEVKNVVVDGNHLHDFVRSTLSTSHPDMIQFWTNGTKSPSVNVTISNNFLDVGQGQSTQSIFMRNEMVDSYGAGKSMYYQNVTIFNNLIRNGHGQGINVGETNGLKLTNNTLLQIKTIDEGGTVSAPSILLSEKSQNVTVTGNVTPVDGSLDGKYPLGWTVGKNFIAQIDNPNAPNYIGALYTDALDKTGATLSDFQVIKGSLLDRSGAGAHLSPGAIKYFGYVEAHQSDGVNYDSLKQSFDATHVFNALGKSVTANASVTWDFGDGSKGTGLLTNHKYAAGGEYTATATIKLANNEVIKFDKTIKVAAGDMLNADFNTGIVDKTAFANHAEIVGDAKVVNTIDGGKAVDLNTGHVKFDASSEFFNNSEYSMLVDFKKDVGHENQGGRLLYFSKSFIVTVGEDGLNISLTTTQGTKTIKTGNLGLADADWHRLGMTFSGESGNAKVYLDGHEVASVAGLKGALQIGGTGSDFYLGGPNGGSFSGQVDNLHFSNSALNSKTMTGVLALANSHVKDLSTYDVVSDFLQSRTNVSEPILTTQIQDVGVQSLFNAQLHHQSDFLVL